MSSLRVNRGRMSGHILRPVFIRFVGSTSLVIVLNEQNHPRTICADCAAKYVLGFGIPSTGSHSYVARSLRS